MGREPLQGFHHLFLLFLPQSPIAGFHEFYELLRADHRNGYPRDIPDDFRDLLSRLSAHAQEYEMAA